MSRKDEMKKVPINKVVTFEKLKWRTFIVKDYDLREARLATKIQALTKYPNGYGASIIQGPHSYGGDEGLYELVRIKYTDDGWHLDDEPRGYLKPNEVTSLLKQIKKL